VPVLCGSAFKNKGVQPLLDAVVDYLPSPLDVPPSRASSSTARPVIERRPTTTSRSRPGVQDHDDPFVGSLTFCRIYSGKLESGMGVLNSTSRTRSERVGRMLLMHANNREDIKEAFAGDIVALVGLKDTTTGDTLCDPNAPVILERWNSPSRSSSRGRAEDQGRPGEDGRRAGQAGRRKIRPSASTDQESGQTIIKGHGRAAPRDHRRPHEARVQGRRQCRRAAGGLSRDHHQAGHRSTTPTRSRPAVRASSPREDRFEPAAGARASCSRDKGGSSRRNSSRRSRRASRKRAARTAAGRLPDDRLQGDAVDGKLPRRRLLALAFEIAARAAFAKRAKKAGRSCSSRS
jgi:hypothetical protein